MNILTEFAQRAPDSPATSAQQLIWANNGALRMARLLGLIPTSGSISLTSTSTEGAQSYDLVSNFSSFLKLDVGRGVKYYDGTDYRILPIRSEAWMDSYVADWHNTDPDEPVVCWKKGNNLYIYQGSSTAITDGLLVYYFAKPTTMTADGDDPFAYGGSDRTDLEDLQEGVVLFMIWKAKQAIGEGDQAREARAEFYNFVGVPESADTWVNEDEVPINEPFRPYHKTPVITTSDPNLWGVE